MHGKLKGCLVCAVAGMLAVGISWAKPAPPEGMDEVLVSLVELEGKCDCGEWSEALKTLDELSENLSRVNRQARRLDTTEKEVNFDSVVKVLRRSIQKKDESEIETNYIYLQQRIFLLTDQFDYKINLESCEKERIMEKALRHILEVYRQVRQYGSSRIDATKIVAKKHRVSQQSVMSACTRDAGIKNATFIKKDEVLRNISIKFRSGRCNIWWLKSKRRRK